METFSHTLHILVSKECEAMKDKKNISFELDGELHKKLKILAIEKGVTLKDLIIAILEKNAK